MPLKLMYITNRPDVARIAERAGVDRIFVDMEYLGKELRQGGLDSVQNHHTVADVRAVREALATAQLLVRVNPIHDAAPGCSSTEAEVDAVIEAGADVVMLPYFTSATEVRRFVAAVRGRATTTLLLETPEAAAKVDDIARIPGVDEIHIGINDLSLGLGRQFMFELLADGTVEELCLHLRRAGIPYGFGGIAAVGTGMLPAEAILREHYRLGSSMVILSRSFCDVSRTRDLDAIRERFDTGIRTIRAFEQEISVHSDYFRRNEREVARNVEEITQAITARRTTRGTAS